MKLDADLPPCVECGACCFSTLPEYVRVFGCDLDRMNEVAQGFTHFLSNRCYMRIEGGHCAALQIDASSTPPSFVCAIYEMRPDVCRSLDRGASGCRAERHAKAERTLIAADSLVRRV